MSEIEIAIDEPRLSDIRALLLRHLAFARTHSPPEDVHALDVEALRTPDVTFFSARCDGSLLCVAALKELGDAHAEIKSMHTAEEARGRGVGRRLVEHVVDDARARRLRRLSLETGTMQAFAPARALYASMGFAPCPPFGAYGVSPNSVCMTLVLVLAKQ